MRMQDITTRRETKIQNKKVACLRMGWPPIHTDHSRDGNFKVQDLPIVTNRKQKRATQMYQSNGPNKHCLSNHHGR